MPQHIGRRLPHDPAERRLHRRGQLRTGVPLDAALDPRNTLRPGEFRTQIGLPVAPYDIADLLL
ncbi:hypothetical protein ABZS68_21865 [Streptomyces sp. NPDC005571]|uniref:hypothetical protein n=1 Tax=Streptomyces sp. NPDC005571 TaxID=3156888 RepID=UPI00339E4B40